MKAIHTTVIEPSMPFGIEIEAGQSLRVFQTEGQQVADVLAFSRENAAERMSMYMSCSANGSWKLAPGHVLVGTRGSTMWTVEADTVGENYLGGGYCNPHSNTRRFGDVGNRTCLQNLNEAGDPFGLSISEYEGDTCLNIAMNVEYLPDGTRATQLPSSRAGDEFIMRAMVDQIVLISNCPQHRGNTNAGRTKSLGVDILSN